MATRSWTVGTALPAMRLFSAQVLALTKAWSLAVVNNGASAVAAVSQAFTLGCALLSSWAQALIEQASSLSGTALEKLQLNQRLAALVTKLQVTLLRIRTA